MLVLPGHAGWERVAGGGRSVQTRRTTSQVRRSHGTVLGQPGDPPTSDAAGARSLREAGLD